MNQDRFKFRAWDQRLKKIVYPDVLTQNINLGLFIQKAFDFTTGDFYYPFDSDLILMQSTGLKDSEETLIYEGDIVKLKRKAGWGSKAGDIEDVKWDTRKCRYTIGNSDLTDTKHLTIIGNIYENSSLKH